MKAVRMHGYGGPEVLVLEEAPRPSPDADEALVHVSAAGVSELDREVREGALAPRALPLIPGFDFAGVVTEIGGDVSDVAIGDEVFGRTDLAHGGAYAEYVAARARDLAKKPRTLDRVHAAAVPTPGITAWQALFGAYGEPAIGLEARQTLLVVGGATSVGAFAVQLARWRGAKIAATADAAHARFVRELGAHLVFDPERHPVDRVLHDVDAVLDLEGGDRAARAASCVRRGGAFVSTVRAPSIRDVRCALVAPRANAAQLTALARLIDAGAVRVPVSRVLPLASAADAQELTTREPGVVLAVAA